MGKRWNNPDFLAGLAEAGVTPELVKFWRSPVFRQKFSDVPAFLVPRFTEMAAEVPDTPTGRRIYYERVHGLLALASAARRTDPASFRLDEPPAEAERNLGRVLGQAFHQGCSIADAALATGLPPDRVVAIGTRTIRRTQWLTRVTADPDFAT
jgi:hypothetical protein